MTATPDPGQVWDVRPNATLHAALVAALAELTVVEKGNTAKIPTKDGGSYCLAPATRVLTDDMSWTPIAKVGVGDRLAAFDEHPLSGAIRRRWRTATVEAVGVRVLPSYRVELSDGTTIEASAGHRWLTAPYSRAWTWRRTADLKHSGGFPHRLVRVTDTWTTDESWAGGYVAGALDGEGCLVQTPDARRNAHQLHLTMAQRDNALLAVVEGTLASHGFDARRTSTLTGTNDDVAHIRVGGGRPEVLRALGTFRPPRLLGSLDIDRLGTLYGLETPTVTAVDFIGDLEVVATRTSTGTLVAEGIASHNSYSYADLPDVVRLTRPALAAHGLVALTPIVDGPAVRVLIVHTSGETLDLGSFPFPAGRDAQATGSAVTYHRRYALLAALGIAADDDDDGHAATQAARRPAKPAESDALIDARAAAKQLGDSARTLVPSIVSEITGADAKLVDLSDDDLRLVAKEIYRTIAHADAEEVRGGA